MKKRIIYFVICLILVNCQDSNQELTFKHSEKPTVINCQIKDSKLFNEAIYSFEEVLVNQYGKGKSDTSYPYYTFLKETFNNNVDFNTISNEHALDVFEALAQVEGLFVIKNNSLSLNYNHEIFNCIGNNLEDEDFKTTFNALLSTNSLSLRMIKEVIMRQRRTINTDKYLNMYIALELYYSKLSDVDLSKAKDASKDAKPKEKKDPHAGHNH